MGLGSTAPNPLWAKRKDRRIQSLSEGEIMSVVAHLEDDVVW
jgi:hypothetical protein